MRDGAADEIQASQVEVQSVEEVIAQLEGNISKQTSALGIAAKSKLNKLKGNRSEERRVGKECW